MTDVVLNEVSVAAEALDFELKSPDRRRWAGNARPTRRALVHGPNDELVVNWDRDYSGAVRINGDVVIEHAAHLKGPVTLDRPVSRLEVTGDVTAKADVKMKWRDLNGADTVARAIEVRYGTTAPNSTEARTMLRVNPDGKYERLILKGQVVRLEGSASLAEDLDFWYRDPGGARIQTSLRELMAEVNRLKAEVAALRANP